MIRAALTGGIATGKSYVARRLAQAGIPLVDADVLAREVVAPGTPALAAIREVFGDRVIQPDGSLSRPAMAAIVFADADARQALETIVHPAVRAGIDRFFESLPATTPLAFADVPLLYETGRDRDFDVVVVAACPPAMQLGRIMARDHATREQAEQRLAAQWPIDDKIGRADFVVSTAGSYEATNATVDALIPMILNR